MIEITLPASFAAPSTPSAVLLATPMISARPPDSSAPEPATRPSLSTATSWPPGNSEARMSSSVMAFLLNLVGNFDERIGVEVRDCRWRGDAESGPDLSGVLAAAKPFEALLEPDLFGL